jgi:hypothetical protein
MSAGFGEPSHCVAWPSVRPALPLHAQKTNLRSNMTTKQRSYKKGRVTITVSYGYDIHSIEFSGRTYERVCSGKALTLKGQGFHWEGRPDQDFWQFNTNWSGERIPGALYVYTADAGEIYMGRLDDEEVWIDREQKTDAEG